jgi:hypothetical protein
MLRQSPRKGRRVGVPIMAISSGEVRRRTSGFGSSLGKRWVEGILVIPVQQRAIKESLKGGP